MKSLLTMYIVGVIHKYHLPRSKQSMKSLECLYKIEFLIFEEMLISIVGFIVELMITLSSNDSNDQNVDNCDLNIHSFHEEVLCKEVLEAVIEENETFIDSITDGKRYSEF